MVTCSVLRIVQCIKNAIQSVQWSVRLTPHPSLHPWLSILPLESTPTSVQLVAAESLYCRLVYRSCRKSFGAAHWLAQCIMWKTGVRLISRLAVDVDIEMEELTFFNAILLSLALFFFLLLHTFGAFLVMVLQWRTLGCLHALC